MRPEITDLDDAEGAPSRAGLVRGVSFATPHPSAGVALAMLGQPSFTPAPTGSFNNAAHLFPIRCIAPGAVFTTTVFVNGQPAKFSVPLTQSSSLACVTGAPPLPLERFAR